MMDAGIAVSKGRPLIEYETGITAARLYTSLKDIIVSPKVKDTLLNLGKIYLTGYWLEHNKNPTI